jgi:hypothetical protein
MNDVQPQQKINKFNHDGFYVNFYKKKVLCALINEGNKKLNHM